MMMMIKTKKRRIFFLNENNFLFFIMNLTKDNKEFDNEFFSIFVYFLIDYFLFFIFNLMR